MEQNIEKLKYPIGKFASPENIGKEQLEDWIKTIEEFPSKLKDEVKNLNDNELEKTYRPNGWTIAQVVNHCADSHTNALIRFKLALTEDTPTIKPYAENLWAELPDSKNFPVGHSLKTLEGLHARWVYLLKNLTESELEKHYFHPEKNEKISLKTTIGLYAWHCEHHLAHIINAKKR
ncbi:MAG: putative metal-dependent hydrolase [Capnocytophaga sp.]|nr:putative metal-dependent hydrolase [Capnocytophaga sp.]